MHGNRNGISTLNQIADLLRGTGGKRQVNTNHPCFGMLSSLSKENVLRLLRKLVCEDVIREKSVQKFKKVFVTVAEPGPNMPKLARG